MEYVQLGGLGAAVIVVFISTLVLTFSCLTTGATRGKIYRDGKCLMGGRCSASFVSYWRFCYSFLPIVSILFIFLNMYKVDRLKYILE